MIIIGFIMGVIATKVFESRKRRLDSKLNAAYKAGVECGQIQRFDVSEKA